VSIRIREFRKYSELPPTYLELLEGPAARDFFSTPDWFEFLLRNIYGAGHAMVLFGVEDAGTDRPLMFVPMRYTLSDSAVNGARTIAALGHLENYAPACLIMAPGAEHRRRELMLALFADLRKSVRGRDPSRADVIRLWPFEVGSSLGQDVYGALKEAGFAVQRYANSYNTYEECAGLSYEDYLGRRSSNQRYNARRRRRNLEKEGELEFELLSTREDKQAFDRAIDDYILVSVHSWKPVGTTVSSSIIELINLAAEQACLRLGILRLDGKPIAAHFWILSGGVASMMRPNYHEDYARLSPGTVLMGYMIEHLLDVDKASSLDLGYGDDEYKGKWVNASRDYEGVMAFNLGTVRGLVYSLRHILGRGVKRLVKGEEPLPSKAGRRSEG